MVRVASVAMGSGMISLIFLVVFCWDYGDSLKLNDLHYNTSGDYNLIQKRHSFGASTIGGKCLCLDELEMFI